MAAAARLKLKQTPTDVWSNKERLCLASSVMRSGDQNWVSVSRAIKPFGEANRPADWFSQKNCALQYSDLLEKVETPKRKRGERGEIETPGESIVRKLTAERIEELKKLIQQEQEEYRKMKRDIYLIQSGQRDDKLNEIWAAILEEKKKEEQAALNHQKWLQDREAAKQAALAAMKMTKVPPKKVPVKYPRLTSVRRSSSQSEQGSEPDSVADSPLSESLNIDTGVEEPQTPETPISQEIATPTTPKPSSTTQPTPTSPLLSSLLKSPTTAATQASLSLLQSTITKPLESPGRPTGVSSITSLLNASPTKPSLLNPPFSLSNDGETTPRPPTSSPSAGAPTLSKLLEMPLASPGKPLPPLPVITTEETHSKITEILSEALSKAEPVVTTCIVAPVVSSIVASETEKTNDKSAEKVESGVNIDSENVSLEKQQIIVPSKESIEESEIPECKTDEESDKKPISETKPCSVPPSEPSEEQIVQTEEPETKAETTTETIEIEQVDAVVETEVITANEDENEKQPEVKIEKLEEEEVIIETVTEEIIEPATMAAEVEVVSEQEKDVTDVAEDSEVSKDTSESTTEETVAPSTTDDVTKEKLPEKEVPVKEEKVSGKPPAKEEVEESKTDAEESKSVPKSEEQTKRSKTTEAVVDQEPKCNDKEETEEEKKLTPAVTDDSSVASSPSTPASHSSGRGRGGRRRGRKPGSGRGGYHNQQSETPASETPTVHPPPQNKMGRGRRHAAQHPKEERKEEKEAKKEEEPTEKEEVKETKEVKTKEKVRSSRQSESNNDSQDKPAATKTESVISPKRVRGTREKEKRKVKEKKEKEKETSEEKETKLPAKETKEAEEKEENVFTSTENSLLEADDKVSEKDDSSNLSKAALCDSIPNSPASTAQSDDQESLRDYKVWKKAIMLVWRSAANHKYANVFLHPVTEEVAPGYHSVVYRPMDLSQIKKNIENGVIKTTTEFQRDMMLMFQDAIMYNNSDHDVFHMAVEMQKEVVRHIQDFLATQLMVQTAEIPKALRRETREHALKRTSESQSEKQPEEIKKTPQTPDSDGPPKPKKRR